MRSKNFFFIIGLVTMLTLLLSVVGCSSDPAPTEVIDPPINNTINDPQFSAVQAELQDYLESSVVLFSEGLSMTAVSANGLDEIVFGPLIPNDSSSADWKVYFLLQAGSQIFGLDSIQFSKNGNPIADGLGADKIVFKHIYQFNTDDTTVSYTNVDVHSDFVFTGIDGSTASINGMHDLSIVDKSVTVDSTVIWTFDINATYSGVSITKSGSNWDSGCPNTGTVTVTVDASYQKDAQTAVTTSWTADVTFTDGNASVDIALGTLSATYSAPICTVN